MDSFKRLGDAIKRYMEGIYGFDKLGGVLLAVAVICILLALGGGIIWWLLALAALVYFGFRALSYDHEARAAENEKFVSVVGKVIPFFGDSSKGANSANDKIRVHCPYCSKEFALPKGLGKLRATCPYCGMKSDHNV